MAAKKKPQEVLSSKDDGYEIQFEKLKSDIYVCRKCSFHIHRGDARMLGAIAATKHLDFHIEDGHKVDPKAFRMLKQ